MEEEEDEDFYAPDEHVSIQEHQTSIGEFNKGHNDEEEGEDIEEDGSDSDIDIITERKPDSKTSAPHPRGKEPDSKTAPPKPPVTKPELSALAQNASEVVSDAKSRENVSRPGSSYPAIKTSTIDVDAKPVYESNGKLITEIDMDADFDEDDKPWRRPGSDMTDFFNYGFDEFTWASYCLKQDSLRKEVSDSKKQMEEVQSFLGGGMPPMPGMPTAQPGASAAGMPNLGAPTDFPPEMQQMVQHMMAQGIDPMQMDASQFMQMFQNGQMGSANQGYGQQGQNQQQMGYGYNSGTGGGGGGGRNPGGRGQGRRWG